MLDEIAATIKEGNDLIASAKSRLQKAYNSLDAIPTTYADEIAEINGYTPTGAFETLAVDMKGKLTTEFQALKTIVGDLLAEFD
jgi:hypothetical protein